mmetsp:Transcript_49835/g.106746  ORF Transcript_49835/g.106746 Transcript_49835/m.106746 type:complete len:290 (+) Transcript_49835:318-1187(+)
MSASARWTAHLSFSSAISRDKCWFSAVGAAEAVRSCSFADSSPVAAIPRFREACLNSSSSCRLASVASVSSRALSWRTQTTFAWLSDSKRCKRLRSCSREPKCSCCRDSSSWVRAISAWCFSSVRARSRSRTSVCAACSSCACRSRVAWASRQRSTCSQLLLAPSRSEANCSSSCLSSAALSRCRLSSSVSRLACAPFARESVASASSRARSRALEASARRPRASASCARVLRRRSSSACRRLACSASRPRTKRRCSASRSEAARTSPSFSALLGPRSSTAVWRRSRSS